MELLMEILENLKKILLVIKKENLKIKWKIIKKVNGKAHYLLN
jgi:hypothetical protein